MNELLRAYGMDDRMPRRTYSSSTDYILSLIELQWEQLRNQRNSVYDSEDCRQKYACRHLMQAIAPHFISRRDTFGPFKLFSDDLCPSNVLVDENLNVTAVIDWEFCYAAPAQFAGSLPWWLILRRPSDLLNDQGPETFLDTYVPKAELFLQVLQEKEGADGFGSTDDRLSERMRESLETRSAWFNFACRMVVSVDLIYWDLLDAFCWGPRTSMAERICKCICGVEMHTGFEDFVRRKIQQLNEHRTELGKTEMIEYEVNCVDVAQEVSPIQCFGLIRSRFSTDRIQAGSVLPLTFRGIQVPPGHLQQSSLFLLCPFSLRPSVDAGCERNCKKSDYSLLTPPSDLNICYYMFNLRNH